MLIDNFSLLVIILLLTIATFTDLRFQKIPNWLTFSAIFIGIMYSTAISGLNGFYFSMKGIAVGIGLLIPFYYIIGGMGAGDVKLMGAIGSFLGPKAVFIVFLMTALAGGVYALIAIALRKPFTGNISRYWIMIRSFFLTGKLTYVAPSETSKTHRLRYGVAIAVGTIVSVLTRDKIYKFLNF